MSRQPKEHSISQVVSQPDWQDARHSERQSLAHFGGQSARQAARYMFGQLIPQTPSIQSAGGHHVSDGWPKKPRSHSLAHVYVGKTTPGMSFAQHPASA